VKGVVSFDDNGDITNRDKSCVFQIKKDDKNPSTALSTNKIKIMALRRQKLVTGEIGVGASSPLMARDCFASLAMTILQRLTN